MKIRLVSNELGEWWFEIPSFFNKGEWSRPGVWSKTRTSRRQALKDAKQYMEHNKQTMDRIRKRLNQQYEEVDL